MPRPGDGENVLDRHQEGLIDLTYRLGDERVHRVHEGQDPLNGIGVTFERLEGGHPDHRGVVAGELIEGEQLADLQLHQVEKLLVVHGVGLVEGHDDGRDSDLAGQQYVLTGLGHRAVGRRDDQDGPVHLGGAGDHVLDVVGMARHVHVGIVALVRLVLDVGDVDRDPALLFLRGLVDLFEGHKGIMCRVLAGEDLGDRRGQGGLAVVDVPHRSYV